MLHPDRGLHVDGDIPLQIDMEHREGVGYNEVTGIRQGHSNPPFPLDNMSADHHRCGRGREDSGAEGGMDSHPRIDRVSILVSPCCVLSIGTSGYRALMVGRVGAIIRGSPRLRALSRNASRMRELSAAPATEPLVG